MACHRHLHHVIIRVCFMIILHGVAPERLLCKGAIAQRASGKGALCGQSTFAQSRMLLKKRLEDPETNCRDAMGESESDWAMECMLSKAEASSLPNIWTSPDMFLIALEIVVRIASTVKTLRPCYGSHPHARLHTSRLCCRSGLEPTRQQQWA